jgi:hypothetical protein
VDAAARKLWPGIELPDGRRLVRRHTAFFGGAEVNYWYFGLSLPQTADVFQFCKKNQPDCPLDAKGRVNWPVLQGDPVYARMPGEEGYSPYWFVWVVTVPEDYVPNSVKSVAGITKAAQEGVFQVKQLEWDHGGTVGKDFGIVVCHLVLQGTLLEGNGEAIPGAPGTLARALPLRRGWHKGYRLELYDFTPNEGVFAPDRASASKVLMPASELWIPRRDCAGGSTSKACSEPALPMGAVSERALGIDLTGDGDTADTNEVLLSWPGAPSSAGDPPYSALWLAKGLTVTAASDGAVALIDTTKSEQLSDLASADAIRAAMKAGLVSAPTQILPAEAGSNLPTVGDRVYYNLSVVLPADAHFP